MHPARKSAPVVPQDPQPKLEITEASDLFLNTDLCECVFLLRRQWGWKKRKRLAEPEISLCTRCSGCCVEWSGAQRAQMYRLLSAFPRGMHVYTHSWTKHTYTASFKWKLNIFLLCSEWMEVYWAGAVWKRSQFFLCEWLSVPDWNDITGRSVFIYSHWSACYNSPDECLRGKLKAIESDATWCLILVAG